MSKQMKLQDMKNNFAAENNHEPAPNVEEIYEEISVCLIFCLNLFFFEMMHFRP